MIKDFILPDIGEGIVECEVVEWKVAEGDIIGEDDVVADVSTDKAIVEIPSMYSGKITKLHYRQGEVAKVHSPLFAIELDAATQAEVAGPEPEAATEPVAAVEESAPAPLPSGGKVLSTPAVRKLARENDIDLAEVPASGKNGRVLKQDVVSFLQRAEVAPEQQAGVDRFEPIAGVRALMGQRMAESVATIPHFTYAEDIDITELMALRQSLKQQYANDDLQITLMPLFIKALSLAIKQFPILNSRANKDFTQLCYVADHNIGMAVDGKTGLLVPNIKGVQNLTLLEVAAEVTRLTAAARSGKISPADLSGGSISISNVGAIGGTVATPIINKPEVAIVALGRVQKLPRFNSAGEVEARQIMTVSWSGDHRVIDGGTIAHFNNLWKQYLEQPQTMLVAMR
ncbi:MAG: 2-oxo acid dehydrogenase subunit E2 [Cellvibrionaceae bacterium]|nr:2-oxo acid dehydrogenase subunit E2 [Cellvibrionaceae bacterium]